MDSNLEKSLITRIMHEAPDERLQHLVKLKPEYFNNPICRSVYKLLLKDEKLELVDIAHKLKRYKTSQVVSILDVDTIAGDPNSAIMGLIEDYKIARLQSLSDKIAKSISKFDSRKIITSIEKELSDIGVNDNTKLDSVEEIEKKLEESEKVEAMRWGIQFLDFVTTDMGTGNVIVIGGKSGMGKSFFALDIFARQVMDMKNILFFSTELKSTVMLKRLKPMFKKYMGLEEEDMLEELKNMRNFQLYDSMFSPEDIALEVKRKNMIQKLDYVIIDHVQDLHVASKKGKVEAFEDVCTMMKELAINANINLILISQLNKEGGYKWASKLNEISSLSLILNGEKREDGTMKNEVELIIDKNRYGSYGRVKLLKTQDFTFEQIS